MRNLIISDVEALACFEIYYVLHVGARREGQCRKFHAVVPNIHNSQVG